MSEESVDIHIRLSRDGVGMLGNLMTWTNYTSKSAFIEEMIMSVENILMAYYTHQNILKQTKTDGEKLIESQMFDQYLLALINRLGWAGYRDYRKSIESEKVK